MMQVIFNSRLPIYGGIHKTNQMPTNAQVRFVLEEKANGIDTEQTIKATGNDYVDNMKTAVA
jgi:hypothetical protein